MPYTLGTQIVEIKVEELTQNPANSDVFGRFDPHMRDRWLVEDIAENGVMLPIVVDSELTIQDGHRRFNAARVAGMSHVPAAIMASNEDDLPMRSAALSRQMKIYAKCRLFRDRIVEVMKESEKVRKANLIGTPSEDVDPVAEKWMELEEILNCSRRSLRRGVRLLEKIENLQSSPDQDEQEHGARINYIFRERGLAPAMRLLDEPQVTNYEEPEPVEDDEPDCGEWSDENDHLAVRPGPRKPAAAPKKPEPELKIAEEPEEEEIELNEDYPSDAVVQDALTHIDEAYSVLTEADLMDAVLEQKFESLRGSLTITSERQAA